MEQPQAIKPQMSQLAFDLNYFRSYSNPSQADFSQQMEQAFTQFKSRVDSAHKINNTHATHENEHHQILHTLEHFVHRDPELARDFALYIIEKCKDTKKNNPKGSEAHEHAHKLQTEIHGRVQKLLHGTHHSPGLRTKLFGASAEKYIKADSHIEQSYVELNEKLVGETLAGDIKDKDDASKILFSKGDTLSIEDIRVLHGEHIRHIFIQSSPVLNNVSGEIESDTEKSRNAVQKLVEIFETNTDAERTKEHITAALKETLSKSENMRFVEGLNFDMQKYVDSIIDKVSQDKNALIALDAIEKYHEPTFRHMVEVMMFSILVGKQMQAIGEEMKEQGVEDIPSKFKLSEEGISELGVGALLHDVGKALVPKAIINKPGPLTETERDIMHMHDYWGYLILSNNERNLRISAFVTGMHHTGPNMQSNFLKYASADAQKIAEQENIKELANIVSVVDQWSALKEKRAYKDVKPDDVTLTIMAENVSKGLLSKEVFEAFLKVYEQAEDAKKEEEIAIAA